jgi:hypothetical protein
MLRPLDRQSSQSNNLLLFACSSEDSPTLITGSPVSPFSTGSPSSSLFNAVSPSHSPRGHDIPLPPANTEDACTEEDDGDGTPEDDGSGQNEHIFVIPLGLVTSAKQVSVQLSRHATAPQLLITTSDMRRMRFVFPSGAPLVKASSRALISAFVMRLNQRITWCKDHCLLLQTSVDDLPSSIHDLGSVLKSGTLHHDANVAPVNRDPFLCLDRDTELTQIGDTGTLSPDAVHSLVASPWHC